MDAIRALIQQRPNIIALAAAAPFVVCAGISAFRDQVPNSAAALALVVIIVAAAATGIRAAGLAAAASSALWFDVLLTQPFGRLAISDREDIETAVLLLAVGLATTELALWGRRQQAQASRTAGLLDGLVITAQASAAGQRSPHGLIADIARRITDALGLDQCQFQPGPAPYGVPVLHHDGTVTRGGAHIDVLRDGLPFDTEIALDVRVRGEHLGCYLLVAATRIVRPSLEQRRIAALLADQAAEAVRAERSR
jgi:K+-sensing histidine kinase KdpD